MARSCRHGSPGPRRASSRSCRTPTCTDGASAMQVILLEKIANVGDLGEVVKVRDGYARNFLIPQGKAKRATPDNLKAIEAQRAELEKQAGARLEAAQALAEKLEGAVLV